MSVAKQTPGRGAGPALWYDLARRDLRAARSAFDSARSVESMRGHKWRQRRAEWLASACVWLVLAAAARERARELRRVGAFLDRQGVRLAGGRVS